MHGYVSINRTEYLLKGGGRGSRIFSSMLRYLQASIGPGGGVVLTGWLRDLLLFPMPVSNLTAVSPINANQNLTALKCDGTISKYRYRYI